MHLKPQRILYVNTPSYIGGSEVSLFTLITNLDDNRYQAYLLTGSQGKLVEEGQKLGIQISQQEFPWFSRRRPWKYWFSVYRLIQMIRKEKISLIHTNCDHSINYVARAVRFTNIPFVSHIRDFVRNWYEPENIVALNTAKCVIANSRAIEKKCTQMGVNADIVRTIYNPVDIDAFQSVPLDVGKKVRSELGIPEEALVVGIVGQIQPIKGHKEFVDAGIQIASRFSNIYYLIVGDAFGNDNKSFLDGLKGQINNSICGDHFLFTGFRNDVPKILKAIDILVVPSWTEPFGRVAVEGMASSCAVIASDAGGLSEIITNGVDGVLIPPKNVEVLEKSLINLMENNVLRQQLITRGRNSCLRFKISNHVNQVESLYDSIIRREKSL